MLKEIHLPPINMDTFDSKIVETGLVVMSNDDKVNAFVIPFKTNEPIKSIQVCYTFKNNSSVIIQDVEMVNNNIFIPLINEIRKHKGVFYLEINVYFHHSQVTIMRLSAVVKRSNVDESGEFLFNHYYKLFDEYQKELENILEDTKEMLSSENLDKLEKIFDLYEEDLFDISLKKVGETIG